MSANRPEQTPAHTRQTSQFGLLRQRRFAPFFLTQFLGAANDNLFKFAFTVLVTYQLRLVWLPAQMAGLVIGALFIIPFVLLSATAGQWADKYDKARVMRAVKALEICIMALAGVGFWLGQVPLLLLCVLLMGVHSTVFGPVKYAYLPQHLDERELTGGNGMVEMGTFVAILLGTVVAGLLMAIPGTGQVWVTVCCLAVAILGWLASLSIPPSPSLDPQLRLNLNPASETWRNLRLAYQFPSVFRSLLGISWMWFFGAVFLSQFPAFARDVLGGDEHVATLLLVVFSLGIASGSLMCERWSHRHVEIGLVPIGALGMTVFALDLYLHARGLRHLDSQALSNVASFVSGIDQGVHIRIMVDLALLAFSAGLYSVPMYALIQLRSAPSHRARIVAANNILNALFMVVSSLLGGALLSHGVSIAGVFGCTAVLNIVVVGGVFCWMPEYIVRLLMLIITRGVYRLRITGQAHLPSDGAAVVVCNPVGVIGALLVGACSPRPMVFLIDQQHVKCWWAKALFRAMNAIPIAPLAQDPEAHARALELASQALERGELLGLFPEGLVSQTGRVGPTSQTSPMQALQPDLLKLLRAHPVPVIPAALHRPSHTGRAPSEVAPRPRPPGTGLFKRIDLVVGQPIAASELTPDRLAFCVQALLAPSELTISN